ncbi:uncharacterized protein [Nicotiana tomentosiformis]|uniref:uncharacterized protein n=1 Tax=Nicotiana tomentosiformis TaxID=4098 RepID=UPI00388C5857
MALIFRYVNKSRMVIERFLSIFHVSYTSSLSLQKVIYSLLSDHYLSTSKICVHGYDGASSMQEKINGLKPLILQDTPSAFCIHFFAHQLQLALVALSNKHSDVDTFFYVVTNVSNTIESSFNRMESLRHHQAAKLEEVLNFREVYTGQVIDLELQEMNARFDIVTTDLLLDMASLSPDDSFANFDKEKIMKLTEYYPSEFGDHKLRELIFNLIVSLSMVKSVIADFST